MPPLPRAFLEHTELGVLCGIALPAPEAVPEAALAALAGEERAYVETLRGHRRVEWIGGRLALREAAAALGHELGPVLSGPRREPLLPPELSGSIAHKRRLAVALVAPRARGTVGVDLEEPLPARPSIARMVLRPEEREAVEALPEAERWPALLARFAVKEAIYKAVHPRVGRFVGYAEAEVRLAEPPEVSLHLTQGEGPFVVEARRWDREGLVLVGVRIR